MFLGVPKEILENEKRMAICNLDDTPGYSGVANPLYNDSKSILLWGDAKASISRLLDALD